MSYGPKQVFTGGVIASATSTGTFMDFGDKSFSRWAVRFPTMSTAGALTVFGSDSPTGIFSRVTEQINSTTVQYRNLTIATTVSGGWATFEAPPFRYVKFVSDVTVTDGSGPITVIAQD